MIPRLSFNFVRFGLLLALLNALAAAEPPHIAEHEIFRAELPIINPYDRALRIIEIDSSCACLEETLGDTFLLPGQKTSLRIAIANHNVSGRVNQRFWFYLSDPQLTTLETEAIWEVIPNIAVDLMPTAGPFEGRPESRTMRDIYRFLEFRRPDEGDRMQRVIRLWSPPQTAPEGGLQVLELVYDGPIWTFRTLQRDDGSILLVARGRTEDPLPLGQREEVLRVRTNHPHKEFIELHFLTAIDPKAGSPDAIDPWSNLR